LKPEDLKKDIWNHAFLSHDNLLKESRNKKQDFVKTDGAIIKAEARFVKADVRSVKAERIFVKAETKR
jgi:hypothetical protein